MTESFVAQQGLPQDREWLVTTPEGRMITARQFPKLLLWQVDASPDTLYLNAPDGEYLRVSAADMITRFPVTVWKDTFQAYGGSAKADDWLSEKLGTEAALRWLGTKSDRVLAHAGTPLSFADGAPFLLTNTASLACLNASLADPVEMARFRPNLVIEGREAYEEEKWKRIRIGEVEFENFKPCTRCVMVTVDLQTGIKDRSQESLSTLAVARKAVFGVNLVALNNGVIKVGDEVEPVSWY